MRFPDGALDRLLQLACLAPLRRPQPTLAFHHRRKPDPARCRQAVFQGLQCPGLVGSGHGARVAVCAVENLRGLDDAPCHVAVFADRSTTTGYGLGRLTMPEMIDYSAVLAVHTLWLAAAPPEGIGVGWLSILEPSLVAEILDVPPGWAFIGYFLHRLSRAGVRQPPPWSRQAGKTRRPLSEVVLYR